MDNELLLKQLVRQMKWLNFWVSLFGILFIISMIISGILLFKAVTYIHEGQQKISDIQRSTSQTLDVKSHVCDSELQSLLGKSNSYCH